MVWLSRFVAALLVSLITVAVLTQIFNSTLLSTKYLDKTAVSAGTYNSLSTDLTNEIVSKIGAPPAGYTSATLTVAIQKVLTPQLIQTKVVQALGGLQAYYKGNGPLPSINLSDVNTQLLASGLPINGQNDPLDKTITLNGYIQVKQQVNHFEEVKLYSAIAALLLLILLIFLSWEEHRWKIIPDLSIIVGVYLGVFSLIFLFSVSIAEKYIKINNGSNDFEGTVKAFAKQLTHGLGEYIGIVALVLLIGGIVGRVLLRTKNKATTTAKSKKK